MGDCHAVPQLFIIKTELFKNNAASGIRYRSERSLMKNIQHLSTRMVSARRSAVMTTAHVAQRLGVPEDLVLDWEEGKIFPSLEILPKIAQLYDVTTDWLLSGELPASEVVEVASRASSRYFNEERMYTYIGAYCNARHLYQTMSVLPYARSMHKGQYRKENGDSEPVPYIYHPLLITCQALAMGIDEDDLLSACLLHDVCEDCGVDPQDLPVSPACQEAVSCLTKPSDFQKTEEMEKAYYGRIQGNRIASVVKVLDRCQNISGMASCFDDAHMARYILETETYVYPLIKNTGRLYPQHDNQMFLLKYHISSVVETIKYYLKRKTEI